MTTKKLELSFDDVLKLKTYCAKQQDFEFAARIRDFEKQFPKPRNKKYVKKEGSGWHVTSVPIVNTSEALGNFLIP